MLAAERTCSFDEERWIEIFLLRVLKADDNLLTVESTQAVMTCKGVKNEINGQLPLAFRNAFCKKKLGGGGGGH